MKSCIDPNKDTIRYYRDTGVYKLIKVTHSSYNAVYLKNLRKDFWIYYFMNGNLIAVTNGHVVDFARVYSFSTYYFTDRKYFYRLGIKYNVKKPDLLLQQADNYVEKWHDKACR